VAIGSEITITLDIRSSSSGKNMESISLRHTQSAFALLLIACTLPCFADSVYKCRNAQGVLEYRGMPCEAQKSAVSSWNAAVDPDLPEVPPMIIKSGEGGHFFVDGTINGNKMKFLIDSGATTVTLPVAMQKSAKLICREDVMVHTANGIAKNCITRIKELRFGKFTINDVVATIAPNLSQPLLGMNVLSQFRIEQDKEEMRISERK